MMSAATSLAILLARRGLAGTSIGVRPLCGARAFSIGVVRLKESKGKERDKDKDKEGDKKKKKDSAQKESKESKWPKQWPREILHKDLEASVTPRLTTLKDARRFLKRLQPEEKDLLLAALSPPSQAISADSASSGGGPDDASADEDDGSVPRPTGTELYHLALHQSLPFIGFGFLDNLVMIMAGEYIDHTIGLTLGISTMAAAALGNAISDVFGIGSAWYVERWTSRLGVKAPALTIEQLELPSARGAANVGRALGVALGCILGMAPLLFQ